MHMLRQGLNGLFAALISIGLVVGGLSISLVESSGNRTAGQNPTPTATPAMPATYTSVPFPSVVPGLPLPPTSTPTRTPSTLLFVTSTDKPTCQYPTSWAPYTIQFGDTLDALASQNGVSADKIYSGNCLDSNQLIPDKILHLPPLPATASPTALPTHTATLAPTQTGCYHPQGWVTVTIQPGDNLFKFSKLYGVSTADLQAANCMGASTILVNKTKFYVPFSLTSTPLATQALAETLTPSQTAAPAATSKAASTVLATESFTPTITPLPSETNPPISTPTRLGITKVPITTITFTVSPNQ